MTPRAAAATRLGAGGLCYYRRMSLFTLGLILIAICIGCLPPLQAGINATLAGYHGHALWGAITNTAVATLTLLVAILVARAPASNWQALGEAPAWSWLGGVLGAAMVLSAILIAPRLGAAAYVSAVVVGTVAASITIDHFGLVGFETHPVNWIRLVGGGLVVSGMVLVQTS